jgi:hypothetical protein
MVSKRKVKLPRSISRIYPNVKVCVDATKPVEVSVNRADCKMAKRLNPSECALAQAAKRELKVDGVVIGMSTSYIIKGDQAIRFSTPNSVRTEIVSFDRHQDFAPGDYYLTPKSPANRIGTVHSTKKGGKNKSAKRKYHHSARVRVLSKGVE